MPPRPPFTRYPSTSSPTYTAPPCPYAGCTLAPGSYHTHYYPPVPDASILPGTCPWPNCSQVLIHSHRYNPSGTSHTLPPPPQPFSIQSYLLTNPELKAHLSASAARTRQETRLRLEQMALREKQKNVQRPYVFRDPSWCGEPDYHEEEEEEEEREEVGGDGGLGLRYGKGMMIIAVDTNGGINGHGHDHRHGNGDAQEGGVKMYKPQAVSRPRLLERRHTLAGVVVVDDI